MLIEGKIPAPFTEKDLEKINEQLQKLSKEKKGVISSFITFFILSIILYIILLIAENFPYWRMTFIATGSFQILHLVPFLYNYYREDKLRLDLKEGTQTLYTETLRKKEKIEVEHIKAYLFKFGKKTVVVDEYLFDYAQKGMKFDIISAPASGLVLEIKPHNPLEGNTDFV
jgi:hypothetical protein